MDQDVQQAAQAQSDGDAAPPKTCIVHAALVPRLNLADFQNAVPALTELAIVNGTDRPLQHLELAVSSEPPFLKPRRWRLDAVGAGQTFHLSERDVQLDGALLTRLTKAEKATVRFALHAQGAEEALALHEAVVELLPRNPWSGLRQLPEMVAAFVQPNDLAVDRLLKAAAEVLRQAGKSGAIDGYTHGAARAWELASAL